jgi:hypothetical protein
MTGDEETNDEAVELEEVDSIAEPAAEHVETPAEKAAADAAKVVDPGEFKRVQRELKETRAREKESAASARYWADQARNAPAKPAEKPAPVADNLDDVDLVDIITTQGAKGLGSVIERMGYVKRSEVANEIQATRGADRAETAVLAAYPALADNSSPLFAKTAEIWNQLKQDPDMARSPQLMMIAARTAAAELGLKADPRGQRQPGRTREPDPDGDDYIQDEDQERSERIARQSGDRGTRPAARGAAAETLNTMQRNLVAKFKAVGADIDEDRYMRRAQGGVRIGGVPTSRARKEAA